MEFTTRTFNKSEVQSPTSNKWLIYTILSGIFFTLFLVLVELEVNGFVLWVVLMASFASILYTRFSDWGKTETVDGQYGKKLAINLDSITIENLSISRKEIESVQFDLVDFRNKKLYNLDVINRSQGVSNKITINTNGKKYSELFAIDSEHQWNYLHKLIKELRQVGMAIEVVNKA